MTTNLLNIEIKDNKVIISIGLEELIFAVQQEIKDFKITNKKGFIKHIVNELENEEEDGTTLVHKLFDEAANNAIENGSDNVKEVENV